MKLYYYLFDVFLFVLGLFLKFNLVFYSLLIICIFDCISLFKNGWLILVLMVLVLFVFSLLVIFLSSVDLKFDCGGVMFELKGWYDLVC